MYHFDTSDQRKSQPQGDIKISSYGQCYYHDIALWSGLYHDIALATMPLILRHTFKDDSFDANTRISTVSYSTIVLYSRDHQGLGVAHKKISPKNQPHFSHMTMWQHWLGAQKSLQIDPKHFQQVDTEF